TKSYFLGPVLLIFGIIRIFSNKSTSWTLTNEDLVIKSGFIPWRKTYFEIPKEDIFEAFYNKSMFGSMFGFGNISIRRTEGTTSIFSCTGMTEPQEITGSINSLVREIKKSPKTQTMHFTNNISLADEIQKLVELKNQGVLNDDEFNSQKQRLINHR
ncbi:MAG: PH domain-containing protein, partial [Bacteroidetes bacterium]|nr:PH domain-containing protein [Bacteroidota bacterium]